ncbi:MAG: c-type cytochrome [Vicingaceae bacterium]|nr:c-type cytochrome [Vicingaceae bacterium]
MNKILNLKSKSSFFKLSLICFSSLFLQLNIVAQNGAEIFNANCTACHFTTADRLVGPGLLGVTEKRSKEWFTKWVKDSQKMVAEGDADAIALFEEYQIPMQSFEGVLTDAEILAVYDFLSNPEGGQKVEESVSTSKDVVEDDALIAQGQKVFKANCSACHSVGANKIVGPGLQGISDKRSEEWLIKWIKNSPELIASGDADANAIFEEYNKMPMPPQAVSDDDIRAMLAYIKNPSGQKEVAATTTETAVVDAPKKDNSTTMLILLIVVIVFAAILLVLLNKSRVSIAKAVAEKTGNAYNGPVTLVEACKHLISNNKGIVAVIVIILFFAGLVDLMDGAMQIGVHQGYKPEQPIKFSHQIHAGLDKIDCNYCHSSARHSKTSGIPSLNVCMNCHLYIKGEGKTFTYNGEEYPMDKEIQKIYTHLDFDPNTGKYGDNQTPVKWIKVHNLPDHAFFSHQQHVTVGKQQCQTCHGPVQEMDVVEQFSPLTMGWCIQCHKETSVATQGNGYYDDLHSRMPEEFKNKVMQDGKITVNEIGGMECAKCHY